MRAGGRERGKGGREEDLMREGGEEREEREEKWRERRKGEEKKGKKMESLVEVLLRATLHLL